MGNNFQWSGCLNDSSNTFLSLSIPSQLEIITPELLSYELGRDSSKYFSNKPMSTVLDQLQISQNMKSWAALTRSKILLLFIFLFLLSWKQTEYSPFNFTRNCPHLVSWSCSLSPFVLHSSPPAVSVTSNSWVHWQRCHHCQATPRKLCTSFMGQGLPRAIVAGRLLHRITGKNK